MPPAKAKPMTTADAAAVEFSIKKARRAQALLAQKVIAKDVLPAEARLVAGVDAAYAGDLGFGAVAVLDYESMQILETQTATLRVKFPYVATLLSFRELPLLVACIRKLKLQPDVFLVDGHGVAHSYRLGLASHLGVVLGKPTVGVAKNRLIGEPKQVGKDHFLVQNGEALAAVVQTQRGAKPVYVSVGNMVSLKSAVNIVKHCIRDARVPEPIQAAHRLASEKRKAKIDTSTTEEGK
ncbi:MAG: endonuclease V [Candidatus Bathyarchaeota archaeon]|nr:endonuclease V [Candidatus Bathyarchaeota archaeon]